MSVSGPIVGREGANGLIIDREIEMSFVRIMLEQEPRMFYLERYLEG